MEEIPLNISVYLVRNKKGKWFRAKGMKGDGDSWVKEPEKARIYTKIGSARSCVTWWTKRFPEYGIPDIVEIKATTGVILDETSRVKKSIDRIKRQEEEYDRRRKENDVEYLKKTLKETQEKLNKLTTF